MHTIEVANQTIHLLDSISYINKEQMGAIVVSASHGGLSSGRYALQQSPKLVVFNDAGIGKDEAGIAALEQLERFNIAAVAVHASSARIGDAEDTWEHGIVSFLNENAKSLGLVSEIKLKEQLESIFSS